VNATRHPYRREEDRSVRAWVRWACAHPWRAAYDISRSLVPLIAVSLAVWAAIGAQQALDQQNQSRRVAIRESCRADEAQADVMRHTLQAFGIGTQRPAPPDVARAFAPLGGLTPLTPAQQRARCDARVKRGIGP
jgi:hypothetical protein